MRIEYLIGSLIVAALLFSAGYAIIDDFGNTYAVSAPSDQFGSRELLQNLSVSIQEQSNSTFQSAGSGSSFDVVKAGYSTVSNTLKVTTQARTLLQYLSNVLHIDESFISAGMTILLTFVLFTGIYILVTRWVDRI